MKTTEQEVYKSEAGAQFSQYMTAVLTVNGTTAGQGITVYVRTNDAIYPIAWSSGVPSDNTSGLQLITLTGGALPLSQIDIKPDKIYFQTVSSGNGGNQWKFMLQCYLVGEPGLSSFEMATNADSSVAVAVSLNSGIPKILGRGWTTFKWQPKQAR